MYESVDLKHILHNFGIKNFNIYKIKEKFSKNTRIVYKVSSFDNFFCLKQSYLKIEELLFIYSYLKWLNIYGFKVPQFIMSKTNHPFLEFYNKLFTLTKWIEGKKLDYNNLSKCIESVILLSRIHKYSSKISLIKGAKTRNNFVNIKQKLNNHNKNFIKMLNKANSLNDKFSNIFLLNFNIAKCLSNIAIKYSSVINFNNLSISVCHGDYVNKNIIMTEKNIIPIDFDKSCVNFSMSDLGYFMRRYLRRSNIDWNFDLFTKLIKYYNKFNPISIDDFLYLISYLSFPQKFWKVSQYYFKNIDSLSPDQKLIYENLLSKTCISMYSQFVFSNKFEKYLISTFNIF